MRHTNIQNKESKLFHLYNTPTWLGWHSNHRVTLYIFVLLTPHVKAEK